MVRQRVNKRNSSFYALDIVDFDTRIQVKIDHERYCCSTGYLEIYDRLHWLEPIEADSLKMLRWQECVLACKFFFIFKQKSVVYSEQQ